MYSIITIIRFTQDITPQIIVIIFCIINHNMKCTADIYRQQALRGDEWWLHDWFTVTRAISEEAAKYNDLSNAYKQYHDSLSERPLQHPAVQPFSKCLALRLAQPVMRLVINHRLEILVNNTWWHLHLQRGTNTQRHTTSSSAVMSQCKTNSHTLPRQTKLYLNFFSK